MSANLMSLARSGGKFLKLYGDRKMMRTLPYLRRVEYLESHGTQWIDTGFVASSETSIKCEFMLVVSNGSSCLFGGRNTYNNRSFFVWPDVNGNSRFDYSFNLADNALGPNIPLNTRTIFEKIKNRNYVNSVETAANSVKSFVCARTSYLFAGNDDGKTKFFSRAKIYDAEIVEGDNSIHFIPVLDLSGRPAMYDEVSGQFFYNQGTGEFTWGELDSQTT